MPEKRKILFISLIIIYQLVYLLSATLGNELLVILLKPGATLLAWLSMRLFTSLMEVEQSFKKMVSYGFLVWLLADLIAMVGELIIYLGGYDLVSFYNLEVLLYAVSRIVILATVAGLYNLVTKRISQFQVMADLITLVVCLILTIWLIFFKPAPQLQWSRMISGDLITIFSFFYIAISLFLQGLLLLNWLYFKERILTIGHRIVLIGLALVSLTDLIAAIYPSLIYQSDTIDQTYKVGILLIAIGGVYFNQPAISEMPARTAQKHTSSWQNGFYFLAYPLFAWAIVGMDMDLLIYFLMIAFYMVSCLYTRQIEVTKALLEKEMAYSKQLKNQHYFTTQLLDALPGGIFYLSRDDQLLGMNNKLIQHFGSGAEAYINRNLSEFPYISKVDYREYCLMKEEVLATRRPTVRQSTFISADGREWYALYSLNLYYLADGSVGGFLGVFTDISEIKEKEKALEVALKNANAATEAKSLFLANMSHEIRTPMNAILGMSRLVMESGLSPRQQDYINDIHSAATALLGIINDILDFSRIESGKLALESVDFDLEKVVNDTIRLFAEKAAERKLSLFVTLPPALPRWFRGDPLRLGQVLINLVGNAVKFTSAGEIEVKISQAESRKHQHQLTFSVRDTGIGIAPDNLERIFESFTQNDNSTTRHYGGTGLGLSISRNLVSLMGGQLSAESQLGLGSTFSFTVWLEQATAVAPADQPAIAQREGNSRGSLAGLRILVAEDNPVNRQIAKEFLQLAGAEVDSVENGEEAVNRICAGEAKNRYDLILMDLQMPVMDGFEATRRIRRSDREIPILALTARTMADEKQECLKNGMNDHISKPIEPQILYQTIKKYVKLPAETAVAENSSAMTPARGETTLVGKEKSAANNTAVMQITEIDWDKLMSRIGNSQELILILLNVFAETHRNMAADLEAALAAGNEELLKQKLHTAKGVLGNIDAIGLYQQVIQIEAALRETGIDAVLRQELNHFKTNFDLFYAAILRFIDSQPHSDEQ